MADAIRYYIGPIDEITTDKLDGTIVTLARNDAITGTQEDAARWDAQPSNYTKDNPKAMAAGKRENK